jgi:hypothetical protein
MAWVKRGSPKKPSRRRMKPERGTAKKVGTRKLMAAAKTARRRRLA